MFIYDIHAFYEVVALPTVDIMELFTSWDFKKKGGTGASARFSYMYIYIYM